MQVLLNPEVEAEELEVPEELVILQLQMDVLLAEDQDQQVV